MRELISWLIRLAFDRVGLLLTSGDDRAAEILALRHQIKVLQRQINRPHFTPTDRALPAVLAKAFDRRRLDKVLLIVKPATVIGWHRRLVARRWTYAHKTKRTGRPATPTELKHLVLRLDAENPTWGYRRIHGETLRLRHRIAASTVWKILRNEGRNPTPNRKGPSWSQFIASQANSADSSMSTWFTTTRIAPIAASTNTPPTTPNPRANRTTECGGLINEYRPSA